MSAFVDTNILVRHLTGDPPAQAAWATKFLVTSDELLLADLVVAEVVYLLESFYQVLRERLAELVWSISAHHTAVAGRWPAATAFLLRPSP